MFAIETPVGNCPGRLARDSTRRIRLDGPRPPEARPKSGRDLGQRHSPLRVNLLDKEKSSPWESFPSIVHCQ